MPRYTLLLPLLFWSFGCTNHPSTDTQEACENHPLYSKLQATEDSSLQVVISLKPEGNENVSRLQDRLLAELEGTEHEVLRRYENFPILSLRVGEEALCRLVTSPLVESVQENVPEAPTGP